MSCVVVGEFCKRPASKVPLRIPIDGSAFVKYFASNEILAVGDFRRPKKPNGYEYEVTGAGQCVKAEPDWPETPGLTVRCGSVEFTCRAISNSSLARVVTGCTWLGGTLTISDEGFVNTDGAQAVFAYAAGGTSGDKGEVVARITFNDGSIEEAAIEYEVH